MQLMDPTSQMLRACGLYHVTDPIVDSGSTGSISSDETRDHSRLANVVSNSRLCVPQPLHVTRKFIQSPA